MSSYISSLLQKHPNLLTTAQKEKRQTILTQITQLNNVRTTTSYPGVDGRIKELTQDIFNQKRALALHEADCAKYIFSNILNIIKTSHPDVYTQSTQISEHYSDLHRAMEKLGDDEDIFNMLSSKLEQDQRKLGEQLIPHIPTITYAPKDETVDLSQSILGIEYVRRDLERQKEDLTAQAESYMTAFQETQKRIQEVDHLLRR